MKAQKKPIEVMAIHYSHNIILDKFLELLRTNFQKVASEGDLAQHGGISPYVLK